MLLNLQIIGHLGRDAEINNVNGNSVVNFSVAHSEKFKDSQGVQTERTTWVSCSLWQKDQLAQYLKKGTLVYISGTPEVRAYMGKDGQPKAEQRLRVAMIKLLSAGTARADQPAEASTTPAAAPANGMMNAAPASLQATDLTNNQTISLSGDDDLPF